MKESNFKPYNLSQAKRNVLSVNRFLGLDLTSPMFNIVDGRAIDLMNVIYKNERVEGRNGIEQILQVKYYQYVRMNFDGKLDNLIYTNGTNINSIWSFVGEDNKQHIIAHIHKLLFEIKNIEDIDNIELAPITLGYKQNGYDVCYEYEDIKSMAFVSGKKLWFLGGNKYMVIRTQENGVTALPVEDSDMCPIPTTTISITYQDSIVNGRASLDKVNLLTKWRKNRLLSGTGKQKEATTTRYFDYTLDAPIVSKNEEQLKLDMAQFEMYLTERGD